MRKGTRKCSDEIVRECNATLQRERYITETVHHGIIKESLYCDHDKKEESSWDQEIFIVIWHGLLIDVVETYEDAEKKLFSFGQGDLYLMYQNMHNERNEYRYKFNAVVSWIEQYLDYEKLSDDEKEKLLKEKIKLWDFHTKWFAEKMRDSDAPFRDFLKELGERKHYDSFPFL